jgi:hypothetical protein
VTKLPGAITALAWPSACSSRAGALIWAMLAWNAAPLPLVC